MKLEGKVAIVTGSSKGIGEGIAREFSHEGANVVIWICCGNAGFTGCSESHLCSIPAAYPLVTV